MVFGLYLTLAFLGQQKEVIADPLVAAQINNIQQPEPIKRQEKIEAGSLLIYPQNKLISKKLLQQVIAKNDGLDHFATYGTNPKAGIAAEVNLFASALNTEDRHEIVSSYLVGYSPFETNNIWIPFLTLSQRKTYQYDHIQYAGRKDVWQTSKQAFQLTRGDCEDHAIALADWLIEMGEDARVVLGSYKDSGHAWVVLFKGEKEFLLEATRKVSRVSLKRYPLATLMTDYRPKLMFNRNDFWANEGQVHTTDYSAEYWVKKSHYHTTEHAAGV